MHHQARSPELQDCIKSSKDCHEICVTTIEHCLKLGGQHASANHLRLMLDCAQICAASEDFLLRGSEFQAKLSSLGAEIGASCATACAKISSDQQMQACVIACQSYADACRKMAASQTPPKA